MLTVGWISAPPVGLGSAGGDWAGEHFETAFEALLPMSESEGVSYRVFRDLYHEQHEYSFVLTHDYNWESFLAKVRKPRERSIWEQLSRLHEADRSAPLEQLLEEVQVDTWHLQRENCPEIVTVLEALTELKVPIHGRIEGIVLHPWVHQIHANGSLADFTVTLTDQEHPLVEWAEETRTTLDRCIERHPAN